MPSIDNGIAVSLLDALALLLLLTAVWSVAVRRLDSSIRLLGLQGLLLTAATVVVALANGSLHAYVAVALTAAIKVLVVPGILLRVLTEVRVKREVELVVPARLALLFALALVLISYSTVAPIVMLDGFFTRNALPSALSMLLIGLLSMLIRKKALNQVVGLVAMENGLYLIAIVATRGLPLAVELGVGIDLVIGVLVMGMLTRWIHREFDTINTDRLSRLRG